ncbi:MAG: polysaccharide pyruvyl transferase family protein [Sedimentisphaerales bacterium]|nr:polysaccharide pyruvyl transferase family protein [Sedimentisphaerales bacterium]
MTIFKERPDKSRSITIGLMGASFDTGNLGVSALAESSIRCILHSWPDAEIVIIGAGRSQSETVIDIEGRPFLVKSFPIRVCPNIFVKNHYIKLLFIMVMLRIFNSDIIKRKLGLRNDTIGVLCRADLIADITGGDSFSDIYGMKRFIRGYLKKRLCQLNGRPFIMLPQTYGPFKSKLSKMMAGRILRYSDEIYSRDRESLLVVEMLIGKNEKTRLSPDIAFALGSRKPDNPVTEKLHAVKQQGQSVIGLNVSGLLYNGGYTGKNEFKLKTDYPELVRDIIQHFSSQTNTYVMLVPHVFPDDRLAVESDPYACAKICDGLSPEVKRSVILPSGVFDQCEIKYIIGQCDFFMGARMHSCIAAISQCIPAIGMAYSKKFIGVFESVGIPDYVVDMRNTSNAELLEQIKNIFNKRHAIKAGLNKIIPLTNEKVLSLFDGIEI